MHADCVLEIAAALGRSPSKREVDEFEAGLLRHMRELARTEPNFRAMSGEQRLQAAAAMAQEATLQAADLQAQRKAHNLLAQARETQRLRERAATLSEQGRKNAHHAALFERMRQVDDYVAGVRNEALSDLVDAIDAVSPKFLGLMDDPVAVRDFARAVMDGKAETPELAKAAKAYTEALETLRVRANASGTDIGKLDYGYLPTPWDAGKVARADRAAFAAELLPEVNRSRFVGADGNPLSDAEVIDVLAGAADTIGTEGRNQRVPGTARGGSRASRFDDAHRVIHFKDADSYLRVMQKYGRGSMMAAIHSHVGQMAKSIGMMEEFGANPTSTFRLLKDLAEQADNVQGARGSGATLDMVWDTLNGTTAQPVDAGLARFWQGVRNFTTAAKLQGVMLSSITDAPLQVLVAKSSGVPTGQAMKSLFAGFGKNARKQAHALALGMDEIAGEMARWHQDHLAQGWTSKLANTTMKATLVEGWTNSLRRGYALTLSSALEQHRKTDWTKLDDFGKRRLEAAGVTEADWKIWQQATAEDGMLTKNGIRSIDPAKLDTILGGEVARIRREAQAQVDQLDARNQQEREWLAKRRATFDQAQRDATEAIENLRSSKDAAVREAADALEIQAQMLEARLELATVAHAAGDVSARGFGRKEGATQQRLMQLESRARELERTAGKAVNKRAEDLGRKLSAHRKELEQFSERATERMKRREAVIAKIGRSVDPALDRSREAAINRATARLLGYLDQEARTAVLSPDLSTRALIQQGTKSGTRGGEILRSVMLFKAFPLAIIDKHLRRIRNIPTTQGKVAYSVAMMASLQLFGAVALQLKDIAAGKDPRDMTTGKFWLAAAAQGGGLGIFGDILYTGMGGNARGGQANWTSLAGPVFGTAFDAADLTLGNAARALAGKDVDFGADLLRFTKGNTPLINLWYLRAAVDHMLLHDLQEELNPGYLRRMRKRSKRDWNQDYWWQPGDAAPDRAPELAAAVGE